MTAARVAALALIGVVGGVVAGALGVGGGILITPALIAIAALDHRSAAATSLAAIAPAALVGTLAYLTRDHVDLTFAALLGVGGLAGTLWASRLARVLPIGVMRWALVGVLVVVATRMLSELPVHDESTALDVTTAIFLVSCGIAMGLVSGLFGLGGGFVAVPALVLVLGTSDLTAKGTALAAIVPIAAFGCAVGLYEGRVRRIAIVLAGSASVGAVLGVATAFLLPRRVLTIAFAVLVFASAAQLAVRAVRARGRSRPAD